MTYYNYIVQQPQLNKHVPCISHKISTAKPKKISLFYSIMNQKHLFIMLVMMGVGAQLGVMHKSRPSCKPKLRAPARHHARMCRIHQRQKTPKKLKGKCLSYRVYINTPKLRRLYKKLLQHIHPNLIFSTTFIKMRRFCDGYFGTFKKSIKTKPHIQATLWRGKNGNCNVKKICFSVLSISISNSTGLQKTLKSLLISKFSVVWFFGKFITKKITC